MSYLGNLKGSDPDVVRKILGGNLARLMEIDDSVAA